MEPNGELSFQPKPDIFEARKQWIQEYQDIKQTGLAGLPEDSDETNVQSEYVKWCDFYIKTLQSDEFLNYAKQTELALSGIEGKTIFFDIEDTLTNSGIYYKDKDSVSQRIYVSKVHMFPVLWTLAQKNNVILWSAAQQEYAESTILPSLPQSLQDITPHRIFIEQWEKFFNGKQSSQSVIKEFSEFGLDEDVLSEGLRRVTTSLHETGWVRLMNDPDKELREVARGRKMPSALAPLADVILIDDAGEDSVDQAFRGLFPDDIKRIIEPPMPAPRYAGHQKMVQQIVQAFV